MYCSNVVGGPSLPQIPAQLSQQAGCWRSCHSRNVAFRLSRRGLPCQGIGWPARRSASSFLAVCGEMNHVPNWVLGPLP
jgi:hypothetical protein